MKPGRQIILQVAADTVSLPSLQQRATNVADIWMFVYNWTSKHHYYNQGFEFHIEWWKEKLFLFEVFSDIAFKWCAKVVEQNRNGNFVEQSKFLFPSEDYRKYRHSSYNCKEESRKNIFLQYIWSESESESDRMFFQLSSWQLQPKCRHFW